ncbi:MAG TPA: cytochrome c biogenesis protein CcsA [Magnetospirillum sp.]|nr:cytochrome c biogenesis protein CcsA [Magnetospirillum sp.]
MSMPILLNAVALASLVPAALVPLRAGARRDGPFWAVVGVALVGTVAFSVALVAGAWQTDLGTALWVSVAATTALFAGLAAATPSCWRLGPLLMPYLAAVGIVASIARGEPRPMAGGAPAIWIDLHILVSVLTYSLLTLAAVASLAVFLQERALKRKRPTRLTRMLPAVVDAERLSGWLLLASDLILGLGIATGLAIQYFETGVIWRLDHKTLLSLIAFGLISALLLGHRVCGVRGRVAARVVLVAYLLLILAFPGVKFVTQVLL